MATRGFEFAFSLDGTAPVIRPVAAENGVTFQKGDLLVLTAGKAALATPADADRTLGVCAEDVTSPAAGGATVKAELPTKAHVYRCGYTGAPDPAAVPGVPALDLVDQRTVNAADVTGGHLTLVELDVARENAYVILNDLAFS